MSFWRKLYLTVSDFIYSLEQWEQRAPWRSWLMHGVVGAALGWLAGPAVVFYVFSIREGEQLLHAVKSEKRIDWTDVFMDIFSPVFVALLLAALVPAFR